MKHNYIIYDPLTGEIGGSFSDLEGAKMNLQLQYTEILYTGSLEDFDPTLSKVENGVVIKDIDAELASLAYDIRVERDRLLKETDWRFRPDLNPSQEWIDYCQALRDIPQQEGFPTNVVWPIKPS